MDKYVRSSEGDFQARLDTNQIREICRNISSTANSLGVEAKYVYGKRFAEYRQSLITDLESILQALEDIRIDISDVSYR